MAVEHRFIFPLPNGLHARPASYLQAVAAGFRSAITLANDRSDAANVKSVLSLVGTDIRAGDPCRIYIEGDDEQAAMEAMSAFLADVLPGCDDAPLDTPHPDGELKLPRSLKAAGLARYLRGTPVSPGVGWGKVVIAGARRLPPGLHDETPADAREDLEKVRLAIAAVAAATEARAAAATHPQEAAILKAHLAIVRDVALADKLAALVGTRKTAAQAVIAAEEFFSSTLLHTDSAYLRERVLDVQDVCGQLLEHVLGGREGGQGSPGIAVQLTEPSVVVADQLTPGRFLALDRRRLKGLVLEQGGTTSHTVILARSMGVPTLVGAECASTRLRPGEEAIVDADLGLVATGLLPAVKRYYQSEADRIARLQKRFALLRNSPATTIDGKRVEIGVNVASAEEVEAGVENGAEGVGLFRTEMLFIDRPSPPDEEEQFRAYARAAASAAGRPVVIRLLDVGGDKPAPYLRLPAEDNPFLGFRGVRIYEQFADLLKSQLRAILRASAPAAHASAPAAHVSAPAAHVSEPAAHASAPEAQGVPAFVSGAHASMSGAVKILVPMIGCIEEVVLVKRLLKEAQDELAAAGRPCAQLPPLGVMIEVPSAALAVNDLCDEADFFSIGSNDLTQYFLAADRANRKVANLYSWANPPFLRLLKRVVEEAHSRGKWVGLCGEMGESAAALPLLVGLGFDEVSLSAPRIPAVKSAVGALRLDHCKQLVERAVACRTRAEVNELLAAFESAGEGDSPAIAGAPPQSNNAPPESNSATPYGNGASRASNGRSMLSADLILRLEGGTKEEVIKAISDGLQLAGRADNPRLLEEAIWRHEDTSATGFGCGFAVPHCTTDHLSANSIAVARLSRPTIWGSVDGNPVDVVILVAVRASDQGDEHQRVLSQLAGLVSRDEFRDRIRTEPDDGRLLGFLRESVELNDGALG